MGGRCMKEDNDINTYNMNSKIISSAVLAAAIAACVSCGGKDGDAGLTPVDHVNPSMGAISHLLMPAFPTVQLPNSMLRVYPCRTDATGDRLFGLPVVVTNHRETWAFALSPQMGEAEGLEAIPALSYDNEDVRPYYYSVYLDDEEVDVEFAPSHQSAVYQFDFNRPGDRWLVFATKRGELRADGGKVTGWQSLNDRTKVYVSMQADAEPADVCMIDSDGSLVADASMIGGDTVAVAMRFPEDVETLTVRYGISFISSEQAGKNLEREIPGLTVKQVAEAGKKVWNDALGKIEVEGDDEEALRVFYTSLYRCYERPICISEDGRYFSAYDGEVHDDGGEPFYVDDWIWDSYRAHHPLRVLIDAGVETDIINSFLLMAEQSGTCWMPTFPEVSGDTHRMNSNHGVATILDAWVKGVTDFDLSKAYEYSKRGIEEKTLIPWSARPAGWLDDFYKKNGYIPALRPGEKETVEGVSIWEKRQPIAVTLGTAYDQWCLSELATILGKDDEATRYAGCALNYRNVFNPATKFFHPKDKDGQFIPDVDYRYDGGLGARDYYDENNGWIYRWDVQHNIADLVALNGGADSFVAALDSMFNEPLGMSKWSFYSFLPDHTGNVGMFSMANEPSLHIPYLYNYAGKPYLTQKRVRTLLDQWFRDDLMGLPGDEDGGGMSAFVVFSAMGFYPVTPGLPMYNIGSPMFRHVTMRMSGGKTLEIVAENYSPDNKYIQSATFNGEAWDKPWFTHDDIKDGGKFVFVMGPKANKSWGADSVPPSGCEAER